MLGGCFGSVRFAYQLAQASIQGAAPILGFLAVPLEGNYELLQDINSRSVFFVALSVHCADLVAYRMAQALSRTHPIMP
jgi:hypothetical protein